MNFYPQLERRLRDSPPSIRSFLSEEVLIADRDVKALTCKYEMSAPSRLLDFLRDPFHDPSEAAVELWPNYSPIKGRSGQCHVDLDDPILSIHLDHYGGSGKLREDLASVAKEIGSEAYDEEIVLGVTYVEVARLALRFGFREMEILGEDKDYSKAIEARHKAFCAVNGKQNRPFELAAVYLSAEEFVAKFGH